MSQLPIPSSHATLSQ